jgi:molecular chaperone DnaK
MVKEAEAHAAEDKKRREEAETRNSAEQLVYSTEKLLTDNDDKLSDDVKTEVRSAVDDLKKALEGDDLAEVTAKQTALVTASQKIGEALYSANQQSEGAPAGDQPTDGPTGSSAQDDDVVDAEIVDDEGEKK